MINLLNKLELDKKKIFLIAGLSVLILLLDVNLVIKKQLKGINNVSSKIVKLRTDLINLNKELAAMQDLQRNQAGLKQTKPLKEKKIISQEEVPPLLQDISNLANRNRIKITQIKPFKKLDIKEGKSAQSSDLIPLLITIDLSSKYHNFGRFINDLENLERFIAVQDMVITRDPDDYLSQDMNLVLVTYVKK